MLNRSLTIIALAASLTVANLAFASDGSSFYFAGQSYDQNNEGVENIYSQLHNHDVMSTTGGGLRIDQNFALEGGYTHYPDANAGENAITKNNSRVYVAGKGIVPLNDHLNFFTKVGAAKFSSQQQIRNNVDADGGIGSNLSSVHNQVLPYVGTGFGYSANDDVDFSMQLAGTPGGDSDLPGMYALTAGISCKF